LSSELAFKPTFIVKISKKLLIPWDESHEHEEELLKGSTQCLKLDQLGGKDWNNSDGGV